MALSQHKLNQGDSDHSQLHCLRLALFAQSRETKVMRFTVQQL